MDPPKRFIERVFEFCAILALSAFLLRLAVTYILEVWPYLLAAAVIALICVIGWRVWRHGKDMGKW